MLQLKEVAIVKNEQANLDWLEQEIESVRGHIVRKKEKIIQCLSDVCICVYACLCPSVCVCLSVSVCLPACLHACL